MCECYAGRTGGQSPILWSGKTFRRRCCWTETWRIKWEFLGDGLSSRRACMKPWEQEWLWHIQVTESSPEVGRRGYRRASSQQGLFMKVLETTWWNWNSIKTAMHQVYSKQYSLKCGCEISPVVHNQHIKIINSSMKIINSSLYSRHCSESFMHPLLTHWSSEVGTIVYLHFAGKETKAVATVTVVGWILCPQNRY